MGPSQPGPTVVGARWWAGGRGRIASGWTSGEGLARPRGSAHGTRYARLRMSARVVSSGFGPQGGLQGEGIVGCLDVEFGLPKSRLGHHVRRAHVGLLGDLDEHVVVVDEILVS